MKAEEHRREEMSVRRGRITRRSRKKVVRVVILLLLLASFTWFGWLFFEIRSTAAHDQAAPADAIAVFGAAEYNGRPSPVLYARLEHGLDLYRRGLAPMMITLGGGGGDPRFTEGGVGRSFLLGHGVPDSAIIAETSSSNTEQSVAGLAAIARENHFTTILAVSDGTHLFRVQQLCAAQGLHVLVSPRANSQPVNRHELMDRYIHEMLAYTLWRMHLH